MERVRKRAFDKFETGFYRAGIYMKENAFYDIIEKRTDETIINWLETLNIPVITVDGRKVVEENVKCILEELVL